MTFEEFANHFMLGAKIDTPQKMAICKHQYQAYLLGMEDDKYFEPLDGAKDLSSIYLQNLYSILNFNKIAEDQLLFLIQPSFEAENLLIIERLLGNYTLTHIALKKSYWSMYYADNSITSAETILSKTFLKKSIGDKIFILVEKAMKEAKIPRANRIVLDGTKYKLSKIINKRRIDIEKHSPSVDSDPGRIIGLMETLIDLTKSNEHRIAEEKIESLLGMILKSQ